MTKQEFIAKYEGWFSYTRREELKKEMEADLESLFIALRQPPVSECNADSDKLVECINCCDKVEMISSGEFCPHCFC